MYSFFAVVLLKCHVFSQYRKQSMRILGKTESQSHRIVEVRRYLWKPCSPTPLLSAGSAEQVAQGYVQLEFECAQG